MNKQFSKENFNIGSYYVDYLAQKILVLEKYFEPMLIILDYDYNIIYETQIKLDQMVESFIYFN